MPFLESKAARTSSSRPWRAERARNASAEVALGRITTLGDTKHATSQAYAYDDEGLRIKITDSATGKVSYHLYDEARHLIAEVEVPSGGALTWKKDLLYVGDKEVAEVDGTHTWVAFLDHLGSPRFQWDGTAVTGIDGVHLIAQKYAPFGESLNDPTTQAQFAKGFTNHEQTDPSGLIYMQARFYAPMYGRFLSPDPARDQHFEETQSWNIYSYVRNQPTMQIDPTGMVAPGGGDADDVQKQKNKQHEQEQKAAAKTNSDSKGKAQKSEKSGNARERATLAGEAALNFSLAKGKLELAAATAPSDESPGVLVTAYAVLSAGGNVATGAIQLTGSLTGFTKPAEYAAEVSATSSSVAGTATLALTGGDLDRASRNAAYEGIITSNPKDLAEGGTVNRLAIINEFRENVSRIKDEVLRFLTPPEGSPGPLLF